MVELRWIKMSLFLILGLQFTAVTGQTSLNITVRDGDEVTLSCRNVMTDQDKCNSATWLFSHTRRVKVKPIELGQIGKNLKAKSDRLSVTVNCSLVIKKVTVEDVGYYTCRQFKSDKQQGQDAQIYLSVVTMTEHKNNDKVTLNCSVSTYEQCRQTVKWVYEGNISDVNIQHMKESQSSCFDTVMFTTSRLAETSNYSESFKCNVTDKNTGKVQLFAFSPQSSAPTTNDTQQDFPDWAKFIIVAVGLASLLIIVLVIIRWKKTKGKKTQMDENIADPEDGVSYVSISFTKKTNSKARVGGDGDDEGDAVTYSTVKASSSSAGASTDPSNLYATINKPNK